MRPKSVQRSKHRPSVLILGGGFAGVSCAGRLSKHRFDVCLVDQKPHFEFLPNIHEILSGVKRPRDVRLNLADQMAALGHRFTQASVQAIAPEGNRVTLDDGTTLNYDFLVVALGAVDAYYGVTGIDANALSFKSAAQCDAIGQRLRPKGTKGFIKSIPSNHYWCWHNRRGSTGGNIASRRTGQPQNNHAGGPGAATAQ